MITKENLLTAFKIVTKQLGENPNKLVDVGKLIIDSNELTELVNYIATSADKYSECLLASGILIGLELANLQKN